MTIRRTVGNVFVVAEQKPDGSWRVDVTDFRYRPVKDKAVREHALETVLEELSSLRSHIWKTELGREITKRVKAPRNPAK